MEPREKVPESVICPACHTEVDLDEEERRAGKFVCPRCEKPADITKDYFQNATEEYQKSITVMESGLLPAGEATVIPESIGGWLILPAIGLILGSILSVIGIFMSLGIAPDLPSRYQGVFALNLLVETGLTAFLIYAAVRFFGKHRNAPATMIALMLTGIVANGLLIAINLGANAEPFAVEYGKALAKGIIGAAIWIPYFLVSTRVKRTFVIP